MEMLPFFHVWLYNGIINFSTLMNAHNNEDSLYHSTSCIWDTVEWNDWTENSYNERIDYGIDQIRYRQ